ncbi:MAG: hypothetical protein IJ849_04435 [Selenomonadaceae bacterium]|nr:hypothetical protein [Selenomonadaceae bacterium]
MVRRYALAIICCLVTSVVVGFSPMGSGQDSERKEETAVAAEAVVATCTAAIEETPDNAALYIERGIAYHKLKRYAEAFLDYHHALCLVLCLPYKSSSFILAHILSQRALSWHRPPSLFMLWFRPNLSRIARY